VRPCPWVGCRHHLAIDVGLTSPGSIRVAWPNRELGDWAETCSLDVADRGPHTLAVVARIWGITRERVRQLEVRALAYLARAHRRESR